MRVRAFLDANIIVSKTLRDWFFKLSLTDPNVLSLSCSELVLEEAKKAFRKRNPTAYSGVVEEWIEWIRSIFDHVVIDAPSSSDHVDGISRHDLHVHRAALRAQATHLVTSNFRDFRPRQPVPYRPCTPDALLVQIYLFHPRLIHEVSQSETAYWARRKHVDGPTKTVPVALADAGAPLFANIIKTLVAP
jgi:hypothetical protein